MEGEKKKVIESDDGSEPGSGSGSECEDEDEDDQSTQGVREWSVVERKKKKKSKETSASQVVTPILVRTRTRMSAIVNSQSGSLGTLVNNDDGRDTGPTSETIMVPNQRPADIEDENESDMDTGIEEAGSLNRGPPLPEPEVLSGRTIFITPKPDGNLRDVIIVECTEINGRAFSGTITYTEAREKIFIQSLGLPATLLHSYKMSFNKCRSISFKLTEQIDVETLADKVNFSIERRYQSREQEVTDVIKCRILGIRQRTWSPDHPVHTFEGSENDIQWVEITGSEYSVEELDLVRWLQKYGEIMSAVSEKAHTDSDKSNLVGTGTYVVKMKLKKQIPQYLPIYGRKLRIYYPGIDRACSNCYGMHSRQKCRNDKVQWISYVRDFMSRNRSIDPAWYGKWWSIVERERDYENRKTETRSRSRTNPNQGQNHQDEIGRNRSKNGSQNKNHSNRNSTIDSYKILCKQTFLA